MSKVENTNTKELDENIVITDSKDDELTDDDCGMSREFRKDMETLAMLFTFL